MASKSKPKSPEIFPALLFITKPKIHSIDKKGRTILQINILGFPTNKPGLIRSSTYTKYTTDQLLFVKLIDKTQHLYAITHIIGDATKLENWDTILNIRFKLPPTKTFRSITPYSPIKNTTLRESTHYTKPNHIRKFLLIDSPGTVDREDGVWYDSPSSYGVFVVDIPTQLGWTHNIRSPLFYLYETWKQFSSNKDNKHSMLTQTFYLPSQRLSLFTTDSYYCVNKEAIDKHGCIPILCYDIPNNNTFPSEINTIHDVTYRYTTDTTELLPSWFTDSPLSSLSVSQANEIINSKWHAFIDKNKNIHTPLIHKLHPSIPNYYPISSPIRSLTDLWN